MKTIQCPMCGSDYDPAENLACPSCPFAAGCDLVKCPRCGYGFPRSSTLLR